MKNEKAYATLILVRHGQSQYNQKNLFTGWTDVDLSEQGRREAAQAGIELEKHGLYPDVCFSSWLKRAIHTAQIILSHLNREYIDDIRSWKLNERHYGDWQGRKKDEVEASVGEKAFTGVRRGYDTPPPPLPKDDPRSAAFEEKYKILADDEIPLSESLADTKRRTLNYFHESIAPRLAQGETVLISAHGNSLRSLVMGIEGLSAEEIVSVEIPTGEIYIYRFDSELSLTDKQILRQG